MLRFTYKYLKPVALFLSIAVLFQCCKVYHKEIVSIEQAVYTDKESIKIITNDDRKFYFSSLKYKDGLLYGEIVKPKKGQEVELKINPDSIKEIHLLNKKASTAVTVILAVGIPVGLITIMVVNYDGPDLSGFN